MVIIVTKKAKNDLYDLLYNAKGNTSNNVLKYIKEVVDYIEIISQSPQIGRIIYKNYRQLVYKKHKIYYIIKNNKIYILRIIHSSRKFNFQKELNLKNFPNINS